MQVESRGFEGLVQVHNSRSRGRNGGYAGRPSPPHIFRRRFHSEVRPGTLVVGVSRNHTDLSCWCRVLDARLQCGIFLPRRRVKATLWTVPSIAFDARLGIACKAKWMELRGVGYHRKSGVRQQLYPDRLSALPAAGSVGLAQSAVLAKGPSAESSSSDVRWMIERNYRCADDCIIRPVASRRRAFFVLRQVEMRRRRTRFGKHYRGIQLRMGGQVRQRYLPAGSRQGRDALNPPDSGIRAMLVTHLLQDSIVRTCHTPIARGGGIETETL